MTEAFLDRLADATPTPGGGSAAAYAAAMAAALVVMAAKLTVGRKKYDAIQTRVIDIAEKAKAWQQSLTDLIEIDASAFERILSAKKLPDHTSDELKTRQKAVEKAYFQAAEIPLQISRITIQVMAEAVFLTAQANINTIADTACAVSLCNAAIVASGNNVKINLTSLRDRLESIKMIAEIDELVQQAEDFNQQSCILMKERGEI